MACSSKLRAGETPTTKPPPDFAPRTASCGNPGQAPVLSTNPRRAISRPMANALARTSRPRWPPADPMTPTVIRSARPVVSVTVTAFRPPGRSVRHRSLPFPGPDLTAGGALPILRPLALTTVRQSDRSMTQSTRALRWPTRRAAMALLTVLLPSILAGCGRNRPGAGGRPGLAPGLGLSHPSVGRLAPEFSGQDPSGPWVPLEAMKERPVALLFFRIGAPEAAGLVR